jgi:hypothetical protein
MARSVVSSGSREAVTVSEWTVRINGVDQASLKPGESVEIGRKPLRPLADDGDMRLDVADQTKSMSKRHALFEVKGNGSASVRDLGSTNGSYVVRDNGDLLRLPANAEFMLPSSPMRMQFGDVPADFIRIDDPVGADQRPKVPDLFGYAVNEAPQEPDAADMSVDDILDLRAGEPTAMFSAERVRRKVDELDLNNLNITQPEVKSEEPALPRDLFADAMAQHAENEAARQVQENMDSVSLPEQPPIEDEKPVPKVVPVEAIAHSVAKHGRSGAVAQPASDQPVASGPVTTAAVAASADTPGLMKSGAIAKPESSPVQTGPAQIKSAQTGPVQTGPAQVKPVQTGSAQVKSAQTGPAQVKPAQTGPAQTAPAQVKSAQVKSAQSEPASSVQSAASAAAGLVFTPMGERSGDGRQQMQATVDELDSTVVYTPAFEPGSVFDRVAKGELKAREQVIEVDGLTSDDAKTCQDFSAQFEIARHSELLVFLAMNPYLYDDMYAWLSARGETDIDEALAYNKGYQEYREAVGK